MRKWTIPIIMLLMLPLVYAITECEADLTPSDIPCMILSSFQYPNNCDTYEVRVYNSTPTLIQNLTMADYGATGYCNVTFNQTQIGSYFMNFSGGESATVVVEDDSMAFVAISIILLGLLVILIYAASKVEQKFVQVFLSLICLVVIALTFFFAASIIQISYPQYTGLENVFWTFYQISVWLLWVGLAFALVALIFGIIRNFMLNERRKRGLDEEDIYG